MSTKSVWRPSQEVSLGNGDVIVVQELAWPQAIEFLGSLSNIAKEFVGGETPNAADIKSRIISDLPGWISRSRELSEFLLTHAVKTDDGDVSGLLQRGVSDVMEALGAAVEINLSPAVTEAVRGLGKKLGVALAVTTSAQSPT